MRVLSGLLGLSCLHAYVQLIKKKKSQFITTRRVGIQGDNQLNHSDAINTIWLCLVHGNVKHY